MTVVYLANLFPSAVEPYVGEEIAELRRRGVHIIAGSVRKVTAPKEAGAGGSSSCAPEIVLQPLRVVVLLRALFLCLRKWKRISPFIGRIILRGHEGPVERAKALLHTLLGACFATRLEGRGVDHIHAHHGYFGSWIALVAARLLNASFSMTLHGSDLLLRAAYLDAKLSACTFCLTISDYNRRYILDRYPTVDPKKILVSRLGVEIGERDDAIACRASSPDKFTLLAVGRLCPVKDHAFLVRACAQLRERGAGFECLIAGDGPERRGLQALIRECRQQQQVMLLGHIPREQMTSLYDQADVVVLTSRSEGIPLVLMEAMARGRIVLAPAITGIPELVIPGQTGFLYRPASLDDFVESLVRIRSLMLAQDRARSQPSGLATIGQLDWIRYGARVQVRHNFNRKKNLESFAELFIPRTTPQIASLPHENSVLQQI